MISREERDALRLWYAAFEPAVDVQLTDDAVFVWSSRPRRASEIVRCERTSDLQQDLNSGLSQLVERMS
jgi:Flp pilus assembly protein TadD